MYFTLFHADCIGIPQNCLYPHRVDVTDEDSLREAVSHDYVAAEYQDGYRSNRNFVKTNCLLLDCDNDFSDDAFDWVTPEDIKNAFPDVAFGIHYSRNHDKSKNGKAPRPKFHCLFPIEEMDDAEAYANLKRRAQSIFPFFDDNAMDAGRFFYGTAHPKVELIEGHLTLTDVLANYSFEDLDTPGFERDEIPEGSRNATLSHFAGRILKRLGDTEEAYNAFLEEASKCNPPLEQQELDTIWRSAKQFAAKVSKQEGYIPPDQYKGANGYKPSDYTDVGQAIVLSEAFGNELRYSPATDYIVYNGISWDESKHGAQAVAHKLTEMQMAEARKQQEAAFKVMMSSGASEILANNGKKKAESIFNNTQSKAFAAYMAASEYLNYVLGRRESRNITATLKEARPMLAITPNDMDADQFLLCTPAATYDLRLGLAGAREHRPQDYITKVTGVSPGTKGAELWESQLQLLFCGDKDLIEYVQLICGLACIGRVYLESMIIAYGEGANGKSTFWNTIARVLGTYSGNLSADALTVGCRRNIKPEMAEAKGKRLIIASELDEGMRLNTATVKQLCSTDEIYAEKKYRDPFSYTPSHTLVLYTNHLPKVGAIDPGTWRRLIVVPFNAKITGKSDKKNYTETLFKEAGESILAWMIEGARKVIEMNFNFEPPQCVKDAIEKYQQENNWLSIFINECCELDEKAQCRSGELYTAYRNHCAETYEYTRSTTDFYSALENAGFKRKKTKEGVKVLGMSLKPAASKDFNDDFLS